VGGTDHESADLPTCRVRGVSLYRLRTATDMRGALAAAEVGREIPFTPKRWFLVYGVPSAETRGQHAHRRCDQLLIAVSGSVLVVVDDGHERQQFRLDQPTLGLYLPAMTWGIQYGYSTDAVLLVLASEPYDPADYIRDYAEFLSLARGRDGSSR
jgi:dTDP-4-dehydrorhamnose 3,5-epimerase-like enzyme